MEHRWGKRVTADIAVQIFADPASVAWGRLRNLSVSGGFIETALRIPVLSLVCLTVPATRYRKACVAHGFVVRTDSEGVGIEWSDVNSRVIETLMRDVAPWRDVARAADEMRLFGGGQPGVSVTSACQIDFSGHRRPDVPAHPRKVFS